LTKEFSAQGGRGKSGIKNYRSDHHEFRNFWASETIKINLEKIKQIKLIDQGLRFDHKLLWVQLGDNNHLGAK
jgi:hypothetical protein